MRNRQIAKQNVIRAALVILREKQALWENLPGMVRDVEALEAVAARLGAAADGQAVTSRGATAAQKASRRELHRLVQRAGLLLARRAGEIGSPELAGHARVNNYALRRGSLMEVLPEARRIEALLDAHPEALAGNLKDPALFIRGLRDAIAAFETIVDKPRLMIVARAVATDQIAASVRQGQVLLKSLDVLVAQFEDEDSAFVLAWKHARKGRAPQRHADAEIDDTPDRGRDTTSCLRGDATQRNRDQVSLVSCTHCARRLHSHAANAYTAPATCALVATFTPGSSNGIIPPPRPPCTVSKTTSPT